ncbi:putative xyloglucan:xyloglucosyl transferase [Helianthus annuus]|uniref:Xyloglucan endotransglucosylase/hydrolase n=1 Tax=Helianthus annuus TaxID=4232 RepID=A0A251T5K7_HELAN|nr:probable xyloglucan endotransglucosylase/hydrolase protein 28 [Helianthus annuus]KAF5779206.1 putative xyloglucan:xyloglucosyl transferase [Helianthus annuus]KAJ0494728.1 putative xyloglucan:xyloglucosyl transferase [Helianthus annuus]KAJ0726708.1 putative xyloglucan:xyloglucosyl transferase [Helianthus annuus]KAJ0867857.1 putative xyloglucan:xyloglucosyl transferase [Helianthus annuus]
MDYLLLILGFVFALASGSSTTLPISSFDEGFSHLFGDNNMQVLKDGKSVHLSLDQRTGSGFLSHDLYLHGFFSASIKLPAYYTAGVVVAFYMSNGDMYEKNHDEIDFEFLGNIKGKEWKIQTNVYGNGSTNVGREERYSLWFDPSNDFHQYSILWTQDHIIFYVDNVAIREIKRTESMGGDFPSKPMTLYATIWDASEWATNGGKYKVNYKYAPYVAEFSNFVLHGCTVDPIDLMSLQCDPETSIDSIIPMERIKMESFRKNHMKYSYCHDKKRYTTPPSECVVDSKEAKWLKNFNPITLGDSGHLHHHGKRHHQS